jgi:V/A-type H+/Na+-transporting ATPase subunit C
VLAAVGYASAQARVRARRDRLLRPETWSELQGPSGPERTLAALRDTPYAPFATDDLLTFETGLRRRQFHESLALAKSVPPVARDLLQWYASRFDVQDLKVLIRALHHGHPLDDALASVTRTEGDAPLVPDFGRVRSLAALVTALDRTPYGRALASAWERYRLEDRPFYLEVALDLAYGRGLVSRIEALSGADRADAVALLGRWLARQNLLAAARYRSLSGVSPEEVVNFSLHRDFGGGLAMVQRIATGGSVRAEAAALGVTLEGDGEVDVLLELERRTDRLRRDAARARFGRSPFGLGLVLAYLIELEAEADDLITLLEAKAQGLDVAEQRRRVAREVI